MMQTYERPEPPLPDNSQMRLLIMLEHVAFGKWHSRRKLREAALYALARIMQDVEK
jgi:hypothetical protein